MFYSGFYILKNLCIHKTSEKNNILFFRNFNFLIGKQDTGGKRYFGVAFSYPYCMVLKFLH